MHTRWLNVWVQNELLNGWLDKDINRQPLFNASLNCSCATHCNSSSQSHTNSIVRLLFVNEEWGPGMVECREHFQPGIILPPTNLHEYVLAIIPYSSFLPLTSSAQLWNLSRFYEGQESELIEVSPILIFVLLESPENFLGVNSDACHEIISKDGA